MNINILLPYKEEYDCNNSGAVSIFVKNNFKYSKLKKKSIYLVLKLNQRKKILYIYLNQNI